MAIIFYDWLERTRPEDVEVVFLHNDTLGEIPLMESWARKFMKQAEHLIGELGYDVDETPEVLYFKKVGVVGLAQEE